MNFIKNHSPVSQFKPDMLPELDISNIITNNNSTYCCDQTVRIQITSFHSTRNKIRNFKRHDTKTCNHHIVKRILSLKERKDKSNDEQI